MGWLLSATGGRKSLRQLSNEMIGDELTLLIYELVQPEPKSERGELKHRWAAAAARSSGPPHPFVEFTSFRFGGSAMDCGLCSPGDGARIHRSSADRDRRGRRLSTAHRSHRCGVGTRRGRALSRVQQVRAFRRSCSSRARRDDTQRRPNLNEGTEAKVGALLAAARDARHLFVEVTSFRFEVTIHPCPPPIPVLRFGKTMGGWR